MKEQERKFEINRTPMLPVTVTYDESLDEDQANHLALECLKVERNPNTASVIGLDIGHDDEGVYADVTYTKTPFDRIRRITGYLVGTTDRFNDAKKAEERDRVKHTFSINKSPNEERELEFRKGTDKIRKEKGLSPIDWEELDEKYN